MSGVGAGLGQRLQSRLRADSTQPYVGLQLTNQDVMTGAEIVCPLINCTKKSRCI